MAKYTCHYLIGFLVLTSSLSLTEPRPLSEDDLGIVIGPHYEQTPLTADDLGTVIGPEEFSDEPTSPAGLTVCRKEFSVRRDNFPDDFIFGTATSAFQIEGMKNGVGRGLSIWDEFTHKFASKVDSKSDGDIGVDFYNRYKEDIELMKDLGTNGFRLSISWPRILPRGKKSKGVSEDGIKFYHDVIDELIKNGIEPAVTLFHWELPLNLEEEYGGFRNKRIVEDFREFSKLCFELYGGKVKNWATFNEPSVYSDAGHGKGKKAPGRCSEWLNHTCDGGDSGFEPYIVAHYQLLAHAAAADEFRKCKKCEEIGGEIGIVLVSPWFEPCDPNSQDGDSAVRRSLDFYLGWFLDPLTYGDYPKIMKETLGERLLSFTEEESESLVNSLDFVGLNYYGSFFTSFKDKNNSSRLSYANDHNLNLTTYQIGSPDIKTSSMGIAIYPEGLRQLLFYIKWNYEDPDIYIMENGLNQYDNGSMDLETELNDISRAEFIETHLLSIQEAIREDKVRVKGYFVWSLMDNFEWNLGYSMRFGLYYVDYKNNLTRHIKESGKWYQDFLTVIEIIDAQSLPSKIPVSQSTPSKISAGQSLPPKIPAGQSVPSKTADGQIYKRCMNATSRELPLCSVTGTQNQPRKFMSEEYQAGRKYQGYRNCLLGKLMNVITQIGCPYNFLDDMM